VVSISAQSLSDRLADLDPVGITASGVHRLAWTAEDAACRAWFERQASSVGLRVERDPAGNLWACPQADPPWWGIGSHLDSVRGGGRFDGPLGVACGFEIAAAASGLPVAVISFADEEGARFNTPTFGSKALTGKLDVAAVLERRDEHGITIAEAMREAGVNPETIAAAPGGLPRLQGFCEIHIDQCQDVAKAGVPIAIVSALAGRMRLEVELRGQADHAGTTPPHDRHDALAAAARVIVAAQEHGRAASGPRVTTARMLIEPNAATTIASHVRLWVDFRDREMERLERLRGELEAEATAIARRERVEATIELASRSEGQEFDSGLRSRLLAAARDSLGQPVPEHVCFAGHDAGVLAERIPAAMVLVRNPTGVSHSPAEHVSLEDAASACAVVATALEEPEE